MFAVELTFLGNLAGLLPRELRRTKSIQRMLVEKTAVKDVIEACRVPHPEVDLIIATRENEDPRAVDFSWRVQGPVKLEIHPVPAAAEVLPSAPRLQVRTYERFVADGHLG